MLEFTEKLTLTPAMMTEDDINALRDAGWTDRDVLDIVMACAYFNFRVRVVDGLGLEIPDMLATRAAQSRTHAAELATQKGRLPPHRHLGRPRTGRSRQGTGVAQTRARKSERKEDTAMPRIKGIQEWDAEGEAQGRL